MSSIFDENNTQEYQFASDGFSDFMDEFQTPKQQQNIVDDFSELEEVISDEQDENVKTSASAAKATASLFTTVLDSTVSSTLGLIANDKPEKFKADSDQRDDLEDALAELVKLKGSNIPPGIAFLILVLSVYGGKTVEAVQLRKANKRNEELQLENARLQAQIELERKTKSEKK